MSALPQGAEYGAHGVTAKGYGLEDVDVSLKDTKTNRYEFPTFVLKHADQKIAGRVFDGNEKPVVGVEVFIIGKGQPMNPKEKWGQQPFYSTNTDNEGRFTFDNVCDAPLRVYAVCPDPLDSARSIVSNDGYGTETRAGDTNIVIRFALTK